MAPRTVCLEVVRRRTFATALDWPGWSRGGRDEAEALDALVRYGPRYATALALAGVLFDVGAGRPDLAVVERLPGTSGTDFGALSVPPSADAAPLDEVELARQVAILGAAWAAFDAAATRHAAAELRKGPRGGGRDLTRMVGHVRGADEAYLVQLGARPPKAGPDPADMTALREAAITALRARALGRSVDGPSRVSRPWTPRWYVRRAAWHALDHAWEIEDRAMPADRTGGA
jgi:hypothetical protein